MRQRFELSEYISDNLNERYWYGLNSSAFNRLLRGLDSNPCYVILTKVRFSLWNSL